MNRQIIYKEKKIPLPFKDADYSDPFEMETVSNPFSGQSIAMPKFAVAVYDVTMGSNHIAERYDRSTEWAHLLPGRMSVRDSTGSGSTSRKNTWCC